jgi:hypothetical protein
MTVTLTILTCTVCGHRWAPRRLKLPERCASCDARNWNDPAGNLPSAEAARLNAILGFASPLMAELREKVNAA